MAKKTSAVTTVEAKKRGVRGFLRVDCGWACEHSQQAPQWTCEPVPGTLQSALPLAGSLTPRPI